MATETAAPAEKTADEAAAEALAEAGWTPIGAPAKLAFIQTHLTYVEKTGRNTHHNYDYFQEHGLIDLLRPLLRQLHCAIVASPAQFRYGRDGNRVELDGVLRFLDTDEPPYVISEGKILVDNMGEPVVNAMHVVIAEFANEGVDSQDKATNKALTGWMKYALQKFFLVPTERVEDADNSEVRQVQEEARGPAVEPAAQADAEQLVADATAAVQAGSLDGNKFKAKLATFKTDSVSALNAEQLAAMRAWTDAEIAKSTKG